VEWFNGGEGSTQKRFGRSTSTFLRVFGQRLSYELEIERVLHGPFLGIAYGLVFAPRNAYLSAKYYSNRPRLPESSEVRFIAKERPA
jgi:hypothetical protein